MPCHDIHGKTNRQTDVQIDRQTDRQTDSQVFSFNERTIALKIVNCCYEDDGSRSNFTEDLLLSFYHVR